VVRAKKSLSQNFLSDPNIRRKLVDALGPGPADVVLEVGPGHGEISELLAERAGTLILVEKDDRLCAELAAGLGARDDVELVHADALECDLTSLVAGRQPLRIISNMPYAITSPLLFRFLEVLPVPRRMVVLVQREVADRITASPGSRTFGALTVGIQARASARVAFRVGRHAFRPVPGVDSAAVVIEPSSPCLSREEIGSLRRLTRAAFSMRRKQMQSILRTSPAYGLTQDLAEAVLADVNLAASLRPEQLTPADFVALADRLEREMADPGGVLKAPASSPEN
jgi:16S rRNA (adenine1518-N6/adenine1519-N6)-dimethyltransferase